MRGGAQHAILSTLIKRDLVQESAVDDTAAGWRKDPEGQRFGLRLTPGGLAAAGVQPAAEPPNAAAPMAAPALPAPEQGPGGGESAASSNHPKGKLGAILQAISAEAGATLDEITAQTGWLPHTARAAITGLRKRGFGIQLITQNERKAYRLTNAC